MVRLATHLIGVLLALVLTLPVQAQSRDVIPGDLSLKVTVEQLPETPFRQEMILLTIHGIYKRHITSEKLEQPDFAGFNWMQLGEDYWYDSMLDGRPVKNMRRRMAVFPDSTGRLEIGPFRHRLTLLDAENKWFEHIIHSAPVSIEVRPEPAVPGWWFPVRRLEVTDNWSNPPELLAPGAGVLRVVRLSALGASPEMLPPMPELKSPSALIFAHPEKRLVDLTAQGPVAIAFWRWTVTPTNGNSAILEPVDFSYYDTVSRRMRNVVISAQRVAFGDIDTPGPASEAPPPEPVALNPALLLAAGLTAFAGGLLVLLRGRVWSTTPLRQWLWRRRLLWRLDRAARRSDAVAVRRSAHALDALYDPDPARRTLLMDLDDTLFGRDSAEWQALAFSRRFRTTLGTPKAPESPTGIGFKALN